MSQVAVTPEGDVGAERFAPALFALAIFTSAGLVFMVEPMIAKLVLPKLGGSPAVWNTSMVFFQLALLLGYGYAHLLQRVESLHRQIVIHLCLLVAAAITLPLRVNGLLGDPPTGLPIPWLLGELTLSIGAPFAVLSATAPLLRVYARVRAGYFDAKNPYVLYAASNLGSFVSLLAYPSIVEPLLRLSTQRYLWTGGYGVFVLIVAVLGFQSWRARNDTEAQPLPSSDRIPWREKADLGAAGRGAGEPDARRDAAYQRRYRLRAVSLGHPARPLSPDLRAGVCACRSFLKLHAADPGGISVCACVACLPFTFSPWLVMLAVNLLAFFFPAPMCHQMLAARRPPPDRLTGVLPVAGGRRRCGRRVQRAGGAADLRHRARIPAGAACRRARAPWPKSGPRSTTGCGWSLRSSSRWDAGAWSSGCAWTRPRARGSGCGWGSSPTSSATC